MPIRETGKIIKKNISRKSKVKDKPSAGWVLGLAEFRNFFVLLKHKKPILFHSFLFALDPNFN